MELLRTTMELLKTTMEILRTTMEILRTTMEILRTTMEILRTPMEILRTTMEILRTPMEISLQLLCYLFHQFTVSSYLTVTETYQPRVLHVIYICLLLLCYYIIILYAFYIRTVRFLPNKSKLRQVVLTRLNLLNARRERTCQDAHQGL